MKFSALIIALLISITTFAQNLSKSSINILGGPSFPIGDFGNKNIDYPTAGLAKLGAFLAVEYDYEMLKDFYLTGRLGGSIHGIDFKYSAPSGSSLNGSTTSWKNFNLFAGFSYMPRVANKLNFIVKALGGYQHTSSPEVNINISGYFNGNSNQESVGSSSLGALVGLGFNYQVAPSFGLRIISDYAIAKPNFEVVQTSNGLNTEQALTSQSVHMLNLGLGFSIRL